MTDAEVTSIVAHSVLLTVMSQLGKVPIIEVAFKKDMWWSIPQEESAEIYQQFLKGKDAGYIWDWRDSRSGSWAPNGETTTINRYVVDLHAKQQRNIDNGSLRSVRVVWMDRSDLCPAWNGQTPSC